MALETFGTNISTLIATNPTGADAKSTADDHLRGIKSVLLAQFPALTAPVTVTHTQINDVVNKAPIASPTFTGIPAGPTATLGTATTQLATMAAVQAGIANVNAQTAITVVIVSATTQAATAGQHLVLTNVAATTVTLSATPASGDTVWVTWTNTLLTNAINPNGKTIMGDPTSMTLDASTNGTVQLRYVNTDWKLL